MGRTVLLVDHGPTLRTVVRLHLQGSFDFIEAADGAAALAALRRREVDLVIVEARGGDHPTCALVDSIRSSRHVPPPVLVVASRPGRALEEAAGAGACAVVRKPVTGPRLRAAIRAVLPNA